MRWRRAACIAAVLCLIDQAEAAECKVGAASYKEGTPAIYDGRSIQCRGGRWQYGIIGGFGGTTEWHSLPEPLVAGRFRLFAPSPAGTPPPPRISLGPEVQPNVVNIGPQAPPSPSAPPTSPPTTGSSQSPPNTFEGAQNLGVLDQPARTAGGVAYFPFHFSKHTINRANPSYTSKFYRFEITRDLSRLRVQLQEEPQTTLLLRLFDSARQQIHESVGSANEQFEKELSRGTYFLQSLRLDSSRCVTIGVHCVNIGRLSIGAFPVPHATDAGGDPGVAHDLGTLAAGQGRNHRETLFRLQRRGAATSDQGLRPPLPQTEADDYLDYFAIVTPARGRLFGSVNTGGLTVQVKSEYAWVTLSNLGVELPAGRQMVRVTNGTASGDVLIGPDGEFWAEYTLTLRFEAR